MSVALQSRFCLSFIFLCVWSCAANGQCSSAGSSLPQEACNTSTVQIQPTIVPTRTDYSRSTQHAISSDLRSGLITSTLSRQATAVSEEYRASSSSYHRITTTIVDMYTQKHSTSDKFFTPTPTNGSFNPVPLAAGISVTFVVLFLLAIAVIAIVVCYRYHWRKSKERKSTPTYINQEQFQSSDSVDVERNRKISNHAYEEIPYFIKDAEDGSKQEPNSRLTVPDTNFSGRIYFELVDQTSKEPTPVHEYDYPQDALLGSDICKETSKEPTPVHEYDYPQDALLGSDICKETSKEPTPIHEYDYPQDALLGSDICKETSKEPTPVHEYDYPQDALIGSDDTCKETRDQPTNGVPSNSHPAVARHFPIPSSVPPPAMLTNNHSKDHDTRTKFGEKSSTAKEILSAGPISPHKRKRKISPYRISELFLLDDSQVNTDAIHVQPGKNNNYSLLDTDGQSPSTDYAALEAPTDQNSSKSLPNSQCQDYSHLMYH